MRPQLCNSHKLTRCNQDLVFFGAQTEEGEVILRVDIPDSAPRLHGEAAEKSCVLHSSGVIQSSSDGNTCEHKAARWAAHKWSCDASSASPCLLPSALTTIVPITPLWVSILFNVSSTSAFGTRINHINNRKQLRSSVCKKRRIIIPNCFQVLLLLISWSQIYLNSLNPTSEKDSKESLQK